MKNQLFIAAILLLFSLSTFIVCGGDDSSDSPLTNNDGNNLGAAYVFKRNGNVWSKKAYLKPPGYAPLFGYSVTLYGDTAVVNSYGGSFFIYKYNGTEWTLEDSFSLPNTQTFFSTRFISLHEDTLAIGVIDENSTTTEIINGNDLSSTNNDGDLNGAVYVYKRSGTTWSLEAYLKAPNNSNEDEFGWSVSLHGDTIAVGATGEDSTTTSIINGADLSSTNNDGDWNGAVYVFKRNGTTWSHEAYLKAPASDIFEGFGHSVLLYADTIAVGAGGSSGGTVYVFKRNGTMWSYEASLTHAEYGSSVSVSLYEDTIAVGDPNEDSTTTEIINGDDLSSTNNDGDSNGAVYVYKRSGTTWPLEAYLKAPNNSNGDRFGDSVSIHEDTIAVGAGGEGSTTTEIINGDDLSSTNNNGIGNGAAYVFKRSGTTWSHEAYLKAFNNSDEDMFGWSVSIQEDTIAVGAAWEDSTTTSIINF